MGVGGGGMARGQAGLPRSRQPPVTGWVALDAGIREEYNFLMTQKRRLSK